YAADAIVAGAKREPSSLVQLQMQSGTSVSMPASFSVRTTSSAASVPSTPSYLPPVGCVSRCEPRPTGGFDISRPFRTPNIEPSASTCTSRPASSHAFRNQSRTCLSSAESVSRRTPPFGVAPNFAVSWMVPQRGAESICRLDAILVIQASGIAWMHLVGLHGRIIMHCLSRHGSHAMNIGSTRKAQGEQVTPSLKARLDCRAGMASTTAGIASGYVQGNLAILPEKLASSFHRFCQLNPKPCPIIGMSDVGNPKISALGLDLDIRTDVPRYRVWRDGEVVEEPTDIVAHWRDDLVAFVLGCSFSFEEALMADGLPIRHIEHN